jgi:hypothetical protein
MRPSTHIALLTLYPGSNHPVEATNNQSTAVVCKDPNVSSNHTSFKSMSQLRDSPRGSQPNQPTKNTNVVETPNCPYHCMILESVKVPNNHNTDLSPMDRFMFDDTGSQPSLFVRPDNGQLSTSKGCTCIASGDSAFII